MAPAWDMVSLSTSLAAVVYTKSVSKYSAMPHRRVESFFFIDRAIVNLAFLSMSIQYNYCGGALQKKG